LAESEKPEEELHMGKLQRRRYMLVYMLDTVNNQLYKEPDAGKPRIRFLREVSPAKGLSTRQCPSAPPVPEYTGFATG